MATEELNIHEQAAVVVMHFLENKELLTDESFKHIFETARERLKENPELLELVLTTKKETPRDKWLTTNTTPRSALSQAAKYL